MKSEIANLLADPRFRPKVAIVSFDNGSADDKPHSHPLGFCCEKLIKYPLDILGFDSRSGVLHCNHYILRLIMFCFEMQETRTRVDRTHRLNCIFDKVEHDLL